MHGCKLNGKRSVQKFRIFTVLFLSRLFHFINVCCDVTHQKVNVSEKKAFQQKQFQGTKIFQYCTCPAGRVTNNIHSSCKHMHLSFKSVCNKEHKGVICNMTSWSYFSQSTHPTGRGLWEELLVLSLISLEITIERLDILSPEFYYSFTHLFKKIRNIFKNVVFILDTLVLQIYIYFQLGMIIIIWYIRQTN